MKPIFQVVKKCRIASTWVNHFIVQLDKKIIYSFKRKGYISPLYFILSQKKAWSFITYP